VNTLFWKLVAWIVTRPRIALWLIRRAAKTPYTHIRSQDGSEVYMYRWWLFNSYPEHTSGRIKKWLSWLPSVRIHHINREDADRHHHDHPWDARTIILRGWYDEMKPVDPSVQPDFYLLASEKMEMGFHRHAGYTGTLKFGEYHRIAAVSPGGVFTLFITYRYRGTWGFLVDGKKVPWREYLGIQ
jgi:hypothetical protein